ncbi:DUF6232 family protein [Streptomyces sp. TLI_105]|uniref:DUF6232 family protein n=1 Tax=Streptomyces sp. TLI_105 TaxID=1881019 RepID=UPI000896BF60|nr:DUF6232 family protein [Streptomyces sp. TLI_105]SED06597.1 hypothetical protein SAMN05428939_4100 [Streptomyces sp. TLI_105]
MGTPPPPASPPPPPDRPWQTRDAAPTVAAPTALPLVISKRLLWVNGAAYPLENIVRVYTFVLRPRKVEAVRVFVKRVALTLLVALGISLFAFLANGFSSGREPSAFAGFLLQISFLGVLGALIWALVDMLAVVTASAHDVLAIETNGRSTAMVSGEPRYLNELVVRIASAIDKPDAELTVTVGALTISNPSNYYFGDAVNIYGGDGHTGVSK